MPMITETGWERLAINTLPNSNYTNYLQIVDDDKLSSSTGIPHINNLVNFGSPPLRSTEITSSYTGYQFDFYTDR